MDNRPGWKGGGREEGGVKGEVWVGGGGLKFTNYLIKGNMFGEI